MLNHMPSEQNMCKRVQWRYECQKEHTHTEQKCDDLTCLASFRRILMMKNDHSIAVNTYKEQHANKNDGIPIPLSKPGLSHIISRHTLLLLSKKPFLYSNTCNQSYSR